jgi:hypothetical protein
MVTHTILFSFPDEMGDADRDEFFREGIKMALDSNLVVSYEHRPSIPLPTHVEPAFVPSAMAQIKYADLESLQKYLKHPAVAEFVQRWRSRFAYRAVSVNTEDFTTPIFAP